MCTVMDQSKWQFKNSITCFLLYSSNFHLFIAMLTVVISNEQVNASERFSTLGASIGCHVRFVACAVTVSHCVSRVSRNKPKRKCWCFFVQCSTNLCAEIRVQTEGDILPKNTKIPKHKDFNQFFEFAFILLRDLLVFDYVNHFIMKFIRLDGRLTRYYSIKNKNLKATLSGTDFPNGIIVESINKNRKIMYSINNVWFLQKN